MTGFVPELSVLPPHQRALWDELRAVPPDFVLYGGTAIALRLGHRQSVDFDFMSHRPFAPESIIRDVHFLADAERLQSQANTLTVSVSRGSPVVLSFFGGISFGRVGVPDRASGNRIWIASLLDLAATKMAVVQQRAAAKDYLDIHAILKTGVSLEDSLAAARALYRTQFNPLITLKALTYFEDGDLPSLPTEIREFLAQTSARIQAIPDLNRSSESLAPAESNET